MILLISLGYCMTFVWINNLIEQEQESILVLYQIASSFLLYQIANAHFCYFSLLGLYLKMKVVTFGVCNDYDHFKN
jgi:hypothetical protein